MPKLTCRPMVVGRRVRGDPHAVFVIHSCFTGDGVTNAAAFAIGPRGWGQVRGYGPTHIEPVPVHTARELRGNDGGRVNISFFRGYLETFDGSYAFFGDAGSSFFALRTLWRWAHGRFIDVRDTSFAAKSVPAPRGTTLPLPAGGCPVAGVYRVAIGLQYNLTGSSSEPGFTLRLFPDDGRSTTYPCSSSVSGRFPLTVMVAHTSAHKLFLHRGTISNRQWVTAPAWWLAAGGFTSIPAPFYAGDVTAGTSPYVVPPSLHVNEMLSDVRSYVSPRFVPGGDHRPKHLARGTASFRRGVLVGLSVDPKQGYG